MSKVYFEVNWSSKADWHSCLDLESLMFRVFVSNASFSIVCSTGTKLFDIVTFGPRHLIVKAFNCSIDLPLYKIESSIVVFISQLVHRYNLILTSLN